MDSAWWIIIVFPGDSRAGATPQISMSKFVDLIIKLLVTRRQGILFVADNDMRIVATKWSWARVLPNPVPTHPPTGPRTDRTGHPRPTEIRYFWFHFAGRFLQAVKSVCYYTVAQCALVSSKWALPRSDETYVFLPCPVRVRHIVITVQCSFKTDSQYRE